MCTLAFLILPGLVAECHFGKWIPVSALLSHLSSGIDRARSDREYAGMVLAQAQEVVPRIQAYRERAEVRRSAQALDSAAIASLQRQIERLLRERRLRPANKLIDKLNLALRTGTVSADVALSLDEVRAQVADLFPSAGERDTFSEAQVQHAHETPPLSLPPGYIGTILPSLNRGSGSGVSGWTNAFILDVFGYGADTRDIGTNLLTDLCNRMLAGKMRSPLWLLSRLVLIPKPSDALPTLLSGTPPVTLRPLGLPEIFYRLAGRAAVRIEAPLVGPVMEPLQLGVGIKFGCQIGAKGAQCIFDSRRANLTWDFANGFNTENRQSTYTGVSTLAPRLLQYYVWSYGKPSPLMWHGHLAGWSGTGVKQGDPAGPLYFAVSTFPLLRSIRDAVEKLVLDRFPLCLLYTSDAADE